MDGDYGQVIWPLDTNTTLVCGYVIERMPFKLDLSCRDVYDLNHGFSDGSHAGVCLVLIVADRSQLGQLTAFTNKFEIMAIDLGKAV